jgi:hypothetical protein
MSATDAPIPAVGEFLSQLLVTDTIVYQVVAVTECTIRVVPCKRGEPVHVDRIDGNPYPVAWLEAIPTDGPPRTVRRRQDGTYRPADGNPLRPCRQIDGKPVSRVDYRM